MKSNAPVSVALRPPQGLGSAIPGVRHSGVLYCYNNPNHNPNSNPNPRIPGMADLRNGRHPEWQTSGMASGRKDLSLESLRRQYLDNKHR